jgi:hypothetical protein
MYIQSTPSTQLITTWRCKFSEKTSMDVNFSAQVAKMRSRFFSNWIQQLLQIHSSAGKQMLSLVSQSLWTLARFSQKLREQLIAWQVTLELTRCQDVHREFAGMWSTIYKLLIKQNLIFSPKICPMAWQPILEEKSRTMRKLALCITMDCSPLQTHEDLKVSHWKQHRFKFIVILL